MGAWEIKALSAVLEFIVLRISSGIAVRCEISLTCNSSNTSRSSLTKEGNALLPAPTSRERCRPSYSFVFVCMIY